MSMFFCIFHLISIVLFILQNTEEALHSLSPLWIKPTPASAPRTWVRPEHFLLFLETNTVQGKDLTWTICWVKREKKKEMEHWAPLRLTADSNKGLLTFCSLSLWQEIKSLFKVDDRSQKFQENETHNWFHSSCAVWKGSTRMFNPSDLTSGARTCVCVPRCLIPPPGWTNYLTYSSFLSWDPTCANWDFNVRIWRLCHLLFKNDGIKCVTRSFQKRSITDCRLLCIWASSLFPWLQRGIRGVFGGSAPPGCSSQMEAHQHSPDSSSEECTVLEAPPGKNACPQHAGKVRMRHTRRLFVLHPQCSLP